jgi:hypothetical protein
MASCGMIGTSWNKGRKQKMRGFASLYLFLSPQPLLIPSLFFSFGNVTYQSEAERDPFEEANSVQVSKI